MTQPPRWKVLLTLGRASNLPTVWSNVLVGIVLAAPWTPLAAGSSVRTVLLLAASMSAYYVGGMFLNDYYDRAIDARQRADRPIPNGWIEADSVQANGYALLVAGFALLTLEAFLGDASWLTLLAGLALAAAIVLYDVWHKNNPLSPVIMGLCRVLVYVSCALAAGGTTPELAGAALALLTYLIGLTYIAKHEAPGSSFAGTWPLVLLAAPLGYGIAFGRFRVAVAVAAAALALLVHFAVQRIRARRIGPAVGMLIAGIALVDALFVASFGSGWWWCVPCAACLATLALQRKIAGT